MTKPKKTGPAPDVVVGTIPWKHAVKNALAKGKPPEGAIPTTNGRGIKTTRPDPSDHPDEPTES